jgi:nicotinamide-nucleotide amidase
LSIREDSCRFVAEVYSAEVERMRAIILSVGDELALGQTVDTNSAWISQRLAAVGCDVAAHLTVPDDQHAIEQAMLESVGRSDFLIVSGGIGPTEDDLTRQALAAVMGEPLELNEEWLKELEAFFRRVKRPMSPLNRIQAMVPRGARMLVNTCGTAAGLDATYQSGDLKTTCRAFVMPGVPKEMKAMFDRDVLPHVRAAGGGAAIVSRTLHTFGLGESAVAEKPGDLMRRDRNPSVGTTVSGGVVSVRINSRFGSETEARERLEEAAALCGKALGDLIYGRDEQTLPGVVGALLTSTGRSVATAESCTGGLLAKYLTDAPGSSQYFHSGWVTYANEAKQSQLGVNLDSLERYGAVSEEVVKEMVAAARSRSGSDYALAISGIAGPAGGTLSKPVGTVCIGITDEADARARTFHFPGDREMVRDRAAKMALTMLRYRLVGKELPF